MDVRCGGFSIPCKGNRYRRGRDSGCRDCHRNDTVGTRSEHPDFSSRFSRRKGIAASREPDGFRSSGETFGHRGPLWNETTERNVLCDSVNHPAPHSTPKPRDFFKKVQFFIQNLPSPQPGLRKERHRSVYRPVFLCDERGIHPFFHERKSP